MSKQIFTAKVAAAGLTAQYSGAEKKFYIGGDDARVKTFIRLCCLKGKAAYSFSIGQA